MSMPTPSLFTPDQLHFARVVSKVAFCNPFLPERIDLERAALGPAFIESGSDWNRHGERLDDHPNVLAITARAGDLLQRGCAAVRAASRPTLDPQTLLLLDGLRVFSLYSRFSAELGELADRAGETAQGTRASTLFARFAAAHRASFSTPPTHKSADTDTAHLFACFFQVRRAFRHIFRNIIGASRPAAAFRAEVWQSIFTCDMHRYRRTLHARMNDFTTLITGPSGTGKELAARAVGLSGFLPFDPVGGRFVQSTQPLFLPLNLSALSPTLIESELFGHKRGAFTGAFADRAGWLETCPAQGAVFLDEIGELEPAIQVKLLRVLQERTFQRIGESRERTFAGRIIAATNRDLAAERARGRFRDDLYYRICSDVLCAPSLREQLDDSPDELSRLVLFICHRIVPEHAQAASEEVRSAIDRDVGPKYPWPGNVRELEQCVRNVLIRGRYHAPAAVPDPTVANDFAALLQRGDLSADALLSRYCAAVYARTGSYAATAKRLGLDRRTVKDKIEAAGTS